jgi:hypothetical protein
MVDFVQVASSRQEVELFDRAANLTLYLPRGGGWVSADSGDGKGLVNSGMRVTPARAALPQTGLPECEKAVFR